MLTISRGLLYGAMVGALLVVQGCSSDEGKPSGSLDAGTTDSGSVGATDSGSADSGGADSGSAKKKLGEGPCVSNDECESNVCFNDKQSWCTLECTSENAATVCVAPLSGSCNNKGRCKRN